MIHGRAILTRGLTTPGDKRQEDVELRIADTVTAHVIGDPIEDPAHNRAIIGDRDTIPTRWRRRVADAA